MGWLMVKINFSPVTGLVVKGFAFEIHYLHGVMQNTKGAPHL